MVELMQQVAASGRVSVTTDAPRGGARQRDLAGLRGHAIGGQRQPGPGRHPASGGARSAARWPTRAAPHVVVFRSTLVPGTVEDVLRPIIEARIGQEGRRGLPPVLPARVPARRLVDPRLRQAAVHRRRRQPRPTRSSACARCSATCRASSSQHLGARGRDDEVLLQQLPRAEDHLRQRNRAPVRGARRRPLRGDGPGVPGHAAQHLARPI